jgi:hypothetical protein
MFAVIYRGHLKPGQEETYKNLWHKIACYFVERRGALGSCLHKTEDGMWLAYSRWPDKATRDASWPGDDDPAAELPEDVRNAIYEIKNCLDQDHKLPEICMEVVDDLLTPDDCS